MSERRPDRRSDAERIYAAALSAGTDIDIDALIQPHPELAPDLRRVEEEYRRIRGLIDKLGEVQTLSDRIRSHYGLEADLRVSLEPEGEADSEFSSEVLGRLAERHGFGRYRLKGEFARGGQGAILRVWDEDLRRNLAMKVMLAKGETGGGSPPSTDSRTLVRFLEEAQVTGQLDHPGIVPVHELGLDSDGRVYFTMKLVKGQDLKAVFALVHAESHGWSQTRALSVLLKVCEAMSYAHSKGVIHRDLKPANVMVGKYGEVYVMDWGLARVTGLEDKKDLRIRPNPKTSEIHSERRDVASPDSPLITMDGDVVGTPAYMSPEQASGQLAAVGPQTDVYAVGAMLYHLLSKQMPYVSPRAALNNYAVWYQVQQGPPKSLHALARDAPAELMAICEKAMEREASGRYADMSELAEDLRAYLEHRVVRAYRTGALVELRKWMVRNRLTAVTAVAALIGTLLFTIWALLERNVARTHEEVAIARKQEFDQLAGVVLLGWALANEAALHPAWPEKIPTMERWLGEDAARLLALKPSVERTIAELERRGSTVDGLAADTRESSRGSEGLPPLAAESQRFLHDALSDLSTGLDAFRDLNVPDVEARLSWARRIEELTLHHPHAGATWEEARAAIARADGVTASELYGAVPIDLRPQWGLVPIGMNPATGLWEFYHLRSAFAPDGGADPADLPVPVHAADGSMEVSEGMGLVFVLIPGGTFRMGSQRTDRDGENFDPHAELDETPVHTRTLAPFFLSRFEMTQGQWLCVTGKNPAHYGPHNYGTAWNAAGAAADLAYPVETVSWSECGEALRQVGLTLPTEAQWEYGARAGTDTLWGFEGDRADLADHANLADDYGAQHGNQWDAWDADLDDGNTVHARVGSYRFNAFGMQDMIGNVSEWCMDDYMDYDAGPQTGDVGRSLDSMPGRVARGGSYEDRATVARVARRIGYAPEGKAYELGCRPARVLR